MPGRYGKIPNINAKTIFMSQTLLHISHWFTTIHDYFVVVLPFAHLQNVVMKRLSYLQFLSDTLSGCILLTNKIFPTIAVSRRKRFSA